MYIQLPASITMTFFILGVFLLLEIGRKLRKCDILDSSYYHYNAIHIGILDFLNNHHSGLDKIIFLWYLDNI